MKWLTLATALVLAVLSGGADAQTFTGAYNAPVVAQTATGIAGLATSPTPVNSIAPSCFTNPADTLASNSNWTSGSTQYLFPPASKNFLMESIAKCATRDVEVQAWTRQGYVYERLDAAGNAIYFFMNGDNSANGYLEFGIVTGLDESAYPGGNYFPLYINADLVHTCGCGYTNAATDGQFFTLGVSGFNIYAKYTASGVTTQFVSIPEYRQMSVGAVAMKSNLGGPYGFRLFTSVPVRPPFLYSSYQTSQLDLRDFDIRATQTTGSISSGSSTLTVASVQGFKVNDWIVVEIGTESGSGNRGSIGVGGQWPNKTYTTTALLQADTSNPTNTIAWAQDTGFVWQANSNTIAATGSSYNSGTGVVTLNLTAGEVYNIGDTVFVGGTTGTGADLSLINGSQVVTGTPTSTSITYTIATGKTITTITGGTILWWYDHVHYYVNEAVPQSLKAQIGSITPSASGIGGTISLVDNTGASYTCPSTGSGGACATATNANVYLDNELLLNLLAGPPIGGPPNYSAITPSVLTISYPKGSFAFAGYTNAALHPGSWIIQGQGQANTTLFSPKGTFGAGIIAEQSDGLILQQFTYKGNAGDNGFGLNLATTLAPTLAAGNTTQFWPNGRIITGTIGGSTTQTCVCTFQQTAGIYFELASNNNANNITAYNVFTNAISCQLATNCTANNFTVNDQFEHQQYVQWQYEWANDTGGGCTDCTQNSTFASNGPECFASLTSTSGPTFLRFTSTNGGYSVNSCGGIQILNSSFTWTTNAANAFLTNPFTFNPNQGAVQIDTNTGGTSGGDVTISNFTITSAYITTQNDMGVGISASGTGLGTMTFSNITWNSPGGYLGPSPSGFGNRAIRSQAPTTNMTNITACGTTQPGSFNIEVPSPNVGTISNSQWHSITTPQPSQGSGNTSC